jgi:hypothetical protein
MGRQSREHRERQKEKMLNGIENTGENDPGQTNRIQKLEEELNDLAGGDAVFWASPACPADVRESNLEDILEFESVGSGISLFEGLQQQGLDLPSPEKLDEFQSVRKVTEVLHALAAMRIFLIGFEEMTGREFYATLWNQTLWEGCYVRKRNPGAFTLIDVSHKMLQSELLQFLENLAKTDSIQ